MNVEKRNKDKVSLSSLSSLEDAKRLQQERLDKKYDSKIRESIDGGGNPFDTLTFGVEGSSSERIILTVGKIIKEKLSSYNLTLNQKSNIKTGILGKIIKEGDIPNKLLNNFNKDLKKISEGESINDKIISNNYPNLNTVVDVAMKDFLKLLESNKSDLTKLNILLSNPKEIQLYTEGKELGDISELQGDGLMKYLSEINKDIRGINEVGGKLKENLMNIMNKTPLGVATLLVAFAKKVLKNIFGEEFSNELLLPFEIGLENRKSVKNLDNYLKNNKDVTFVLHTDDSPESFDFDKIKVFLEEARDNGIDVTDKNFWKTIFEGGKFKGSDLGKEKDESKDGKKTKTNLYMFGEGEGLFKQSDVKSGEGVVSMEKVYKLLEGDFTQIEKPNKETSKEEAKE